jgi:large subunit ribosomal protein L31
MSGAQNEKRFAKRGRSCYNISINSRKRISIAEVNCLKKEIHPEYYDVTVTCACGNRIETRSTKKEIAVDICSNCHPFFTGKQKLVDSEGRVQRFRRRYNIKD